MGKKVFIATVQLTVTNCDTVDEAADAIHGLLHDFNSHEFVADWGYLKVGEQWMWPQELIGVTDPYIFEPPAQDPEDDTIDNEP